MVSILILAKGETPKARDNARGHLFELMVGDIFSRLGHRINEFNSHQSGGEIDMICQSLIGKIPCVIECKAHQRSIPVGDLKKFRSTYEDQRRLDPATIGIMVSLAGFGPDAQEYYRREIEPHYPHFEIWDATRIYELLLAAGLITTHQAVKSLVEFRTGLTCDTPELIYALSQYFWLVKARGKDELRFTRFLITDSNGMLLRDPVVLNDLATMVSTEVDSKIICANGSFPEPYHRAVFTEAGRYFGLRGHYQFPARKTLREVLDSRRADLCRELESLLGAMDAAIGGVPDAKLWRIHGEETERILDLMIPDEVKEDLFPSELALLVAGARYHCLSDIGYFKRLPFVPAPEEDDAATRDPANLSQHLRTIADRLHEPFARTGRHPLIGHEKIDLDFITACIKLTCGLDLAFFRSPASVYNVIETQNLVSEDTFLSFQSSGLNLDYNEHRVSIDVKCYTPEAHLVVLRLADWAQSTLDDIEPILYERGIRFLRVNANIEMQNYEMVGCRFEVHTESIVRLLMGRALYGTEDVAVRELVQNAMDAVFTQSVASGDGYAPSIEVRLLSQNGADYLEVEDNGCGMDRYIVQRYLSAIGKSFWRSEDFSALTGVQATEPETMSIGQFGIGILSAFMVGDQIEIDTKTENSDGVYIGIPGVRDYFVVQSSARTQRGTRLRLRLTKEVDVKGLLEKYIIRPRWPVTFVDKDGHTHTFASDPQRLWKRLRVPRNLSGGGRYYGISVPIEGDGFEGQLVIALPGDMEEEPPKRSTPYYYRVSPIDYWSSINGGFVLTQSGVLVKETVYKVKQAAKSVGNDEPDGEDLDDDYRYERSEYDYDYQQSRSAVGFAPSWVGSCAGYLDCLPGLLELTVSRNDVVEGKLPDKCLQAVEAAKLDAFRILKSRCDDIWRRAEWSPSETKRQITNASIGQFSADKFKDDKDWKRLIQTRYSLRGQRVRDGKAEKFFATAEEIKKWPSGSGLVIFSIYESMLNRWKDVLIASESRDVVYIFPSSGGKYGGENVISPALHLLGASGFEDRRVIEQIDIVEVRGKLTRYVPGYCGFCRFRRPRFNGIALRWNAQNWYVQRSEAADITRLEYANQMTAKGRRIKLPKVMFNLDHPAVDALRLAAEAASEADEGQLQRVISVAVRLSEAQSARQRGALFKEFSREFETLLRQAIEFGIDDPEEVMASLRVEDFAYR